MNFPSQTFYNGIGYKAALLKKNSYWLLSIYMGFLLLLWKGAQNECALPKCFYSFSTAQLNNIESEE